MSNVQIMDHPLIKHKISYIRQENVGSRDFRAVVGEIAALMCYEATRNLKLQDVKIKTPICETVGQELSGKKMAVVPILRAGIGMVDGILNMIPAAKVGHIGLYRDLRLLSRWSITASFRLTVMKEKSSWWIPCWLPADPALRRSRC